MRARALAGLLGCCCLFFFASDFAAATTRKPARLPHLIASPSSLDFGSVTVGASASQSLVLSNTGRGDATINTVSATDPTFGVVAPVLPFVLKAGYSITLTINFVPSVAANVTATLAIEATGIPTLDVSLAGTGVAPLSAPSPHDATLTWVASTSPVDGYNVYRSSTSGGPYTRINAMIVTVLSFDDTNVAAGQTYYYVVTATASGVESSYSNEVQAVIPSP